MPKLNIVRQGRRIGFMTLPERAMEAKPYPLLERFTEQRGLAIVVEIDSAPFACVVFKWDEESIDIGRPARLLWPSSARSFLEEAAFWFVQQQVLMNDVEVEPPSRPSGRRFEGRLRSVDPFPEGRESSWSGEPFELEIEDESLSGRASVRGVFGGRFGPQFWRGYLHASLSSGGLVDVETDFRIDIDIESPRFEFGEAYIRWGGGESDFELDFSWRLKGFFGASARLRARGGRFGPEEEGEQSGEASFPASILWLIQNTIERLSSKPSSRLTIWIGPVSYNEQDVIKGRGTREALAESILSRKHLGAGDVAAILSWLRTSASVAPEARYFLERAGLYGYQEQGYEKGYERRDEGVVLESRASQRLKEEIKSWQSKFKGLQAELASKEAKLARLKKLETELEKNRTELEKALKKASEQAAETTPEANVLEEANPSPKPISVLMTFDSTLSTEKAMTFLAELTAAVQKKGGHFCLESTGSRVDVR
jgi:hypothetical protein